MMLAGLLVIAPISMIGWFAGAMALLAGPVTPFGVAALATLAAWQSGIAWVVFAWVPSAVYALLMFLLSQRSELLPSSVYGNLGPPILFGWWCGFALIYFGAGVLMQPSAGRSRR